LVIGQIQEPLNGRISQMPNRPYLRAPRRPWLLGCAHVSSVAGGFL
jgi:hypothetical protein